MKQMYCWRCDEKVPMLNEEEFAKIQQLYLSCRKSIKEYRKKQNASLQDTPTKQFMRPVRKKYQEITGTEDYTADEILKHRISLYGQPCPNCGKPLRTPNAKMCATCGTKLVA